MADRDMERIKELYKDAVKDGRDSSQALGDMIKKLENDKATIASVVASLAQILILSEGAQLKLSMAFGLLADYVEQMGEGTR